MTRPTRTSQDEPREVTEEDRSAAAEMSARGSFLPPRTVPKRPPGRWGRAIKNFSESRPGENLPGPKP